MNDKLKELLGEELAKQVSEKLGDVELGITNDGTLVPADKHDNLKAEHKSLKDKYRDDMKGLNDKLGELSVSADASEELKQTLETMKSEQQKTMDEYDVKIKQMSVDNALEITLIKSKAKNTKAVKALLDMSVVNITDDTLIGVTEQIAKLKESDGYLFDTVTKTGTPPPKGLPVETGDIVKLKELYEKAAPMDRLVIMDKIKLLQKE